MDTPQQKLRNDINQILSFANKTGINLEVFEENSTKHGLCRAYISSKPLGGMLATGTPENGGRWVPIYPKLEDSYPIKGTYYSPSKASLPRCQWWQALILAVEPAIFKHPGTLSLFPAITINSINNINYKIMKFRADRRNKIKVAALLGLLHKELSKPQPTNIYLNV